MTTIYDECSKDELLQIVCEMQNDLNDSKKENKELHSNINDLQSELAGATNDYNKARNEIKLLNKQIDRHITAVHDLTDFVKTSHKVIADIKKENNNLRRNIEYLCDENVRLRHELNEVQSNDNNY